MRAIATRCGELIAALTVLLAFAGTARADVKLAPHYAPMFVKGKTFHYVLSRTEWDLDAKERYKPMKPVTSTLTCTVTDVARHAKAMVSKITCSEEIDSDYAFRPDGVWVATAAGVGRSVYAELPAEADATFDRLAVAAKPVTKVKRTKDDYGGVVVDRLTAPASGTWCTVSDTTKAGAGDGAIETLCFTAGVGISSGKLDYYGGMPRIVAYTLAK